MNLIVVMLLQSEDVNLDPKLSNACQVDIPRFCGGKVAGRGEILECLEQHAQDLSEDCKKIVLKREVSHAAARSLSCYMFDADECVLNCSKWRC